MNRAVRFLLVQLSMAIFWASSLAVAQSYMGNLTSCETSGKQVVLDAEKSALRFVFYKPNLVRVDILPASSTVLNKSLVVIQDTVGTVDYSIANVDSTVTMTSSALEIRCDKFPLRVKFYDVHGHLILQEPLSGGMSFQDSTRTARFAIQQNEHFYGTGERGRGLDLKGQEFDSFNQQRGGYPVDGMPATMNVNVPFVISTAHYGIYFDDTYKGHFDIGNSDPSILAYTVYGGELSYYFIYDSTMKQVLSDYTWLTGRAPLLPAWAYGYIQSKFGYKDYTDADEMITKMKKDSIPCSAIVLDLYWFKNMGDLWWNTDLWPDPMQVTSSFLSQGFRTIVITEPYITQPSDLFGEADSNGYLAKDSTGRSYLMSNWWSCRCNTGLLDITNPAAREWWWEKYDHIFQSGVAGLWTDLGEPERDYSDMRFKMGPDMMVHNIYDFLWAKTLFDGYNESFPDRRLFNLTRSGYAGIQRFGVVTWSGDVAKTFGGLEVQIPLLLNMGMSGISYHNSDIGGFNPGSTTPELYTRWMEFGAFSPVMRAHGYDGDGGTEPWVFGKKKEDIVREMIRLRYKLFPYNYTMAHLAYGSGVPLCRPLILEYPDDPNVCDESSAYMWGDDFLVAPVVKPGETIKSFYLPKGKWIDFWSDRVYRGGRNVTVPAPIDHIPLFVKSGSVIPFHPPSEESADTVELAIYPDSAISSHFQLYEDDGKTLGYQRGLFATTLFEEDARSDGSASSIHIHIGVTKGYYTGKPSHRMYLCKVHMIPSSPNKVSLDGVTLPESVTTSSFPAGKSSYHYDGSCHILYIEAFVNCDSAYSIDITNASTLKR